MNAWLMYKLIGDAPPLPSVDDAPPLPSVDDARADLKATEPARLDRAHRLIRKEYDDAIRRGRTSFSVPMNADTTLVVESMRERGWEVKYEHQPFSWAVPEYDISFKE